MRGGAQFTAGDPLDQGVIDTHDHTFAGYHQFAMCGGNASSGPVVKTGSFQVFHADGKGYDTFSGPGWYWWPWLVLVALPSRLHA